MSSRSHMEFCGCEIICCSKQKRFVFRFLQCCATPIGALIALSVGAFLQGFIVNGLVNASISTLEKRFELGSAEAGLIASCYDIAQCILLLFVSYIGARGSQPLWLGSGIIIMGIGSVVLSLPRFIAPTYEIANIKNATCHVNESNSSLGTCTDLSLRNFRFMLYAGQLLTGVGATPLYTLGITYIDENVKQTSSSLYHGIFMAASVIGPGIGYLLAGYFLSQFTVLGKDNGLLESNSQFVGAWWLGFLIFGIITVIAGIPILWFPRVLPGTEEVRKNREQEMYQDQVANEIKENISIGSSIKDFPKCLVSLLRNPTFMCVSLAAATEASFITGISTFGAKVVQSLFGLTTSNAAFLVGIIAIISGAGSLIGSGLIVAKCKLCVRQMLTLCIVVLCLSWAASFILLLSCDNNSFAGATVAYKGVTRTKDKSSLCNANCSCDPDVFDPVCGSDGVTYYSPCYAGCTASANDTFMDCECVGSANGTFDRPNYSVAKGFCSSVVCPHGGHHFYLAFIFVLFLLTFLAIIPGLQITMRVVPFSQRALATGVQWLLTRTLGSIPGPLLYGFAFDKACLLWGSKCGERGSCSVYTNKLISRNLFIVTNVLKVCSIILFVVAFATYNPNPTIIVVEDTPTDNASSVRPSTNPATIGKISDEQSDGQDNPTFKMETFD